MSDNLHKVGGRTSPQPSFGGLRGSWFTPRYSPAVAKTHYNHYYADRVYDSGITSSNKIAAIPPATDTYKYVRVRSFNMLPFIYEFYVRDSVSSYAQWGEATMRGGPTHVIPRHDHSHMHTDCF